MKFSQTLLFSIAAAGPQRRRRQNDVPPDGLPEIQPTIDPTDLSTTESIDDILLNFQTSPDPFDLFDFLQTTKDPIFEELLLTTPATNIEEDFDFAALATTESIDALLATEPSLFDLLGLGTTAAQFPSELPPVPTEESASISAILLEGINPNLGDDSNLGPNASLHLVTEPNSILNVVTEKSPDSSTLSLNTTTEASILSKIKENFDETAVRLDNFLNSVLNSPFLNNEITTTTTQITTTLPTTIKTTTTLITTTAKVVDLDSEIRENPVEAGNPEKVVETTENSVETTVKIPVTLSSAPETDTETLEPFETIIISITLPFEGIAGTEEPQSETTAKDTPKNDTPKIETENWDSTTVTSRTVTTSTTGSTTVIETSAIVTTTKEETSVTDTPTTEINQNATVTQAETVTTKSVTTSNTTTTTAVTTPRITTRTTPSRAVTISISIFSMILVGLLNVV